MGPRAADGACNCGGGAWAAQEYGCDDKQLVRLARSCGIRPDAAPLDRQYLFTVYTHPSSSFKGGPAPRITLFTRVLTAQLHSDDCRHLHETILGLMFVHKQLRCC